MSRRAATGVTARVYRDMRREFGIHAEPFALHSPDPELLAGVWMACRETLVARGLVERSVKEAVATAVSSINRCPFCVDAHAVMLAATGSFGAASRLERGALDDRDPALAGAVEWALATRAPGAQVLENPPFGEREAPEMVGTAVLFHYINRPVTVFAGDPPLAAAKSRLLRQGMLWLAGRRFRRFVRRRPAQGDTLDLLPEAELPADLQWARGSPVLASAWARFAAAVERAGERALPHEVRTHVRDVVREWRGNDPGLGGDWVERELEGLAAEHRSQARLALLAALAPYRLDENVVGSFRQTLEEPGGSNADDRLVGAVSWASFTAARRVGSWLGP